MIVKFKYRNHRGEIAVREIKISSLEFVREPGFGYQSGWFISGYCLDRNARRSFALNNIVMDEVSVPKFFTLLSFKEGQFDD